MTGPEFSGVDIDLLADYVGGVLDGTPDEAVVAALIEENADWHSAYTLLADSVVAVTGQLQALGAAAEPMPADVLTRLDAALLAEAAADRPGTGLATVTSITDRRATAGEAAATAMEPGTDGDAPAQHVVATPPGSRSRRARRLRWAAPVGIAAGVLAFVGFGVQQLSGGSSQDTASSAAGPAVENAAPLAAGDGSLTVPGSQAPVTTSGTDYTRALLGQARSAVRIAPEPGSGTPAHSFKNAPSDSAGALAESALDQLRTQAALQACIDAIAAQQPSGEIVAESVEFARFEGVPAVIVQFTSAGQLFSWASGARCGTPGVGADKLAAVKVG